MCVYIYTHIYVYKYIYIHTHTHTHIYICFSPKTFMTQSQTGRQHSVFSLQLCLISLQGISLLFQFRTECSSP